MLAQIPLPNAAEDAPAAEAEQPEAPQPLRASEIPARFEETAALLREISKDVADIRSESDVDNSPDELRSAVKELKTFTDRFIQGDPTFAELEDVEAFWSVALARLQSRNDSLANRARSLEEMLSDLKEQTAEWSLTIDAASEQSLDSQAVQRIREVDRLLRGSKGELTQSLNRTFQARSSISDIQIEVDEILEQLKSETDSRRVRLFSLDRKPIWKAGLREDESKAGGVAAGLTTVLSPRSRKIVGAYALSLVSQILGQAGLFVCVAVGLIILRRRSPSLADDPDPAVRLLAAVLQRPFSSALLLAVLAGSLIYTGAPRTLANLAWLVLLIPLLRLFPQILSPEFRRCFYGLAALYGAERVLIAVMPDKGLIPRLAVLALMILTGAYLWWLSNVFEKNGLGAPGTGIITALLRLGAVTAAVAAVCDIVGAFALGQFLLDGLLRSVYGAALVAGFVLILRGFVHLMLRSEGFPVFSDLLHAPNVQMRTERGLALAGVVAVLTITLKAFSLLEPARAKFESAMATEVSIGELEFAVGDVAVFVGVLLVALIVSKLLRFFLEISVYPKVSLQRGISESFSRILHYGVILMGLLFAFGAAGIELTQLAMLAGALTVGLGFGLRNIVENFVSGLILLFERPIQVGDNITVGDTAGIVTDIGIRASTVRTFEGADVVIPNGTLISDDLTNWTLSDAWRRVEIPVGVAYGSDPDVVMKILTDLAANHPRVATHKAPASLFVGFGESSLDFLVRFWTRVEDFADIRSELHKQIARAFASAGVKIPFPQRDLNVKSPPSSASIAFEPSSSDIHRTEPLRSHVSAEPASRP